MPRYWMQKVQDALNDVGKAVKGSQVLILGVSYKKDVSDLRESPALDIIHLLQSKGADVLYHDPYVSMFEHQGMSMFSVANFERAVSKADCIVIVTDHSLYDWDSIVAKSRILVDTRHVTIMK